MGIRGAAHRISNDAFVLLRSRESRWLGALGYTERI